MIRRIRPEGNKLDLQCGSQHRLGCGCVSLNPEQEVGVPVVKDSHLKVSKIVFDVNGRAK